jgi:hypothetical protein
LEFNTPYNRVLLAALVEVGRLAQGFPVSGPDLAKARGLALLFSDCRDTRIVFGTRSVNVALAERLVESGLPARRKDPMMLAAIILAHESFEGTSGLPSAVPRSWFLNLETLFETAVRLTLRALMGDMFSLEPIGTRAPGIFEMERREFRAHPDFVMSHHGRVSAVGDAKYKPWAGGALASDLYQLLVHSAAFGSSTCFLVFPNESFEYRGLGQAVTGATTWLFGLRLNNLKSDLQHAIELMGALTP